MIGKNEKLDFIHIYYFKYIYIYRESNILDIIEEKTLFTTLYFARNSVFKRQNSTTKLIDPTDALYMSLSSRKSKQKKFYNNN